MKLFQNKAEGFYFFLVMILSVVLPILFFVKEKNLPEAKEFFITYLPGLVISVLTSLVIIRPDFSRRSVENCLGLPLAISLLQSFFYAISVSLMHVVSHQKTESLSSLLVDGLAAGVFMNIHLGMIFFINIILLSILPNFYIVSFLVWKFKSDNERSSIAPLFLGLFLLLASVMAFLLHQSENADVPTIFSTAIFFPLLVIAGIGLVEAVGKWRMRRSIVNALGVAAFVAAACFTAYCLIRPDNRRQEAVIAQGLEAAKRIQERTNRDNQIEIENKKLDKRAHMEVAPPLSFSQEPKLQTIYRFHHPAGNWFYAHKPDGQPEDYVYEGPVFRLSAVPVDTSEAIYVCGHAPDFYLGTSFCAEKVTLLGYPSRTKTDWAPFFVWSCYGGGGQILSINRNDCEGKTNVFLVGFVGSTSKGQFAEPKNNN